MSNREDYLDNLLRTVTDGSAKQQKALKTDDEFLDDFEKEMEDMDTTSFLDDFEQGLDGLDSKKTVEDADNMVVDTMRGESFGGIEEDEDLETEPKAEDDIQLEELETMLKAAMEADVPDEEPEMEVDTLSDMDLDMLPEEDSTMNNGSSKTNTQKNDMLSLDDMDLDDMHIDELSENDKDILDILTDMEHEGLEDLSDMLKANGKAADDVKDATLEEGKKGRKGKKEKKPKKEKLPKGEKPPKGEKAPKAKKPPKEKKPKREEGEKGPFGKALQKVALIVFGEDDEIAEIPLPDDLDIENMSEEDILAWKKQEKARLDQEEAELKKAKKEEKAQQKKEKKDLKAQTKKAKPPKPPKPPKEKKPKEVDTSPPLPKGPLVLILLMGASIIVLVLLSSQFVGYTVSVSQAESAYAEGDYVEAYKILYGTKIKEVDQSLYDKAYLNALMQREWQAYQVYNKQKQYPEALNALVCGTGRYNKNYEAAQMAGVEAEYDKMLKSISKQLSKKFKLSVEDAQKLYDIGEKKEYTQKLYEVLHSVGLAQNE
ncbi:hypothetical protein LQZ18_11850 [Lachnospiraceae bacterium ZAX-1]